MGRMGEWLVAGRLVSGGLGRSLAAFDFVEAALQRIDLLYQCLDCGLFGLRLCFCRASQRHCRRYCKDNTAPTADVSHLKYPPGRRHSERRSKPRITAPTTLHLANLYESACPVALGNHKTIFT